MCVEADYAPAALDKIACNGASHDAETYNSNGFIHAC
jgi:hypothetical protein